MLRCRISGTHAYLVQYGRGRRVTLGDTHKLKPAEARSEATKILGDAAKGIDVIAARRVPKAQAGKSYLDETYSPYLMAKRRRRINGTVQSCTVNLKHLKG